MSAKPWMKFYPRDWRGDQALRVCSLAARGLWMEMLCVMHEATPYGHLLVGGQPVKDDVLARLVGAAVGEVQAMLVELREAGVFRQTRTGVIYSKRMTDDHKRSIQGRRDKLEGIEKTREKPRPSRSPKRNPATQRPEARGKVEAHYRASTLTEATKIEIEKKEEGPDPNDERGWLIDAQHAETEAIRCKSSDPDRSSELAEFAAIAKDTAAALRRARLTVVAA